MNAHPGEPTFIARMIDFISTDAALHDVGRVVLSLFVVLLSFSMFLKRDTAGASSWLAPRENASKRACEIWFLLYGIFWILCFGSVVVRQTYLQYSEIDYMVICVGLATPLLLQPIFFPSWTKDEDKPLLERHSFKANLWIFVFSFIGNYWYTHYFYNILKASYSFRSWDINGVPIALIFATHFYFSLYHTLSNLLLNKIQSSYKPGRRRLFFEISVVLTFSYITAFMESLTISGFQCYKFEDRYMAWLLGSAFYGIYFIVSFPMYFRLDSNPKAPHTAFQALVECLATGMIVLCLLDFTRLALHQDITFSIHRPCKLDASKTCQPFTGMRC